MSKIKLDREKIESVFKHHSNAEAVYVTSDGNIFLKSNHGRNFCVDHCKRIQGSFAALTREEFEKGIEELEMTPVRQTASNGEPKADKKANASNDKDAEKASKEAERLAKVAADWKLGKWDELLAFAKSKGLDAQTKKTQGKDTLIEEIESYIKGLEIGATNTTNHITE